MSILYELTGIRGTHWSPSSSIRDSFKENDNKVILSDPLLKKRLLIPRQLFLEFLQARRSGSVDNELQKKLKDLGFYDPEIDEKTMKRLAHWFKRRWIPSLDYYLWSRGNLFADKHDLTGEQRKEVLKGYVEKEAPPERIVPKGKKTQLVQPVIDEIKSHSFGDLLMKRKSTRHYLNKKASLQSTSNVIWYGLDKIRRTRIQAKEHFLGYLQSHGVAFDFYFVIYSVEGIEPGIYYYDFKDHSLIQVKKGCFRDEMTINLFGQPYSSTANWTLCIVADFKQYLWRYRHERALRHLYLEAGRVGQHFLIAGMTNGFGTITTPAIKDKSMAKLLNVHMPRQLPIYTLTMGLSKSLYRPAVICQEENN